MDIVYCIDKLFGDGFVPESKREKELIQNLKDEGFVRFNKDANNFRVADRVSKLEDADFVTLKKEPMVFSVSLVCKADNFVPSLAVECKPKAIFLEYLGDKSLTDAISVAGKLPIGKEYSLTVLGYGKNENNEGYKVLLEDGAEVFARNAKFPYGFMSISVSKTGKTKDTKNLEFIGVRPAKLRFKLGLTTSIGTVYDLAEIENGIKTIKIDKAEK